ncbi:MAG: hypothetical protein K8L99_32425 [Anaerolineae bacterium]|nr:hypothetical protein [Anaerolineae bacterium]
MENATRILRQRHWTTDELRRVGFRFYHPVKRVVMARVLTAEESPKKIDNTKESLIAKTGDIICYTPGDHAMNSLDDYHQWPVRADLFRKTYRPWDEIPWKPNAAEADLMLHGCKPFYKFLGVWAMHLRKDVHIQSLESPKPVQVTAGRWLCIGAHGEPYHMSDKDFRSRYQV